MTTDVYRLPMLLRHAPVATLLVIVPLITRASPDSWCEQWWRTREPSEVLGKSRQRHQSDDEN